VRLRVGLGSGCVGGCLSRMGRVLEFKGGVVGNSTAPQTDLLADQMYLDREERDASPGS
jgi:hypothetical protein